jgi:hypothetical protein
MKRILVIALAALLSLSALAVAQEDESIYVWINFMKAKPGQGDALAQLLIQEDGKLFDPLVESGAAVGWGVAMPVIHDGDDAFSHVEWVSFRGWAGADAFMAKFMEWQQSMAADERKAMAEKWEAVVVDGSHADTVNRSIHVGSGAPARPGYIHLGYHTAKPGKAGDAKSMYDELAVPVYDKLVSDGAIFNYGLHVPAIHRGEGWTHMSWYSSADLAARDKVSGAFDAAEAARSAEENAAVGERWASIFEPSGHSDQILLVIHFKGPGGGGE